MRLSDNDPQATMMRWTERLNALAGEVPAEDLGLYLNCLMVSCACGIMRKWGEKEPSTQAEIERVLVAMASSVVGTLDGPEAGTALANRLMGERRR